MYFSLLPFADNTASHNLDGSFDLRGHDITCRWRLEGALDKIMCPPRAASPQRKMSLWEHTCFEFFIGGTEESGYFEFNLSPSGHWNSFSFNGARTGMCQTSALCCTASAIEGPDAQHLVVQARLNFVPPAAADRYRVGVSAVIEDTAGERHYYALSHDGPHPDFHQRSTHWLILP